MFPTTPKQSTWGRTNELQREEPFFNLVWIINHVHLPKFWIYFWAKLLCIYGSILTGIE